MSSLGGNRLITDWGKRCSLHPYSTEGWFVLLREGDYELSQRVTNQVIITSNEFYALDESKLVLVKVRMYDSFFRGATKQKNKTKISF